mgnify:CR=1 FL=1
MTTYRAAKSAMLSTISLVLMTGAFLPTIARASVFAGLLSTVILNTTHGVGGAKKDNVQVMSLPTPVMNINPVGRGGGDIEIVDDSALVPQDGPLGTAIEVQESIKSSQISVYTVRPGDTLSTIATMFDVTVNTIMWANDIKSTKGIRPGDSLVILPVTGIRYTVKSGGSLRDIVKKHGGDLEEAALYNGVEPDEILAAGTVLIVPDAELIVPKPETKKSSAGVKIAVRTSSKMPSYSGYYQRPTNGTKTQGIHGYNGVDIGAPVGTSIWASAGGEVIIARSGGYNGGYGSYVVIRHDNGTQTLYAHMSRVDTYAGQVVSQGEEIGAVGNSGRSTGPHLHFEIRGAVNPF